MALYRCYVCNLEERNSLSVPKVCNTCGAQHSGWLNLDTGEIEQAESYKSKISGKHSSPSDGISKTSKPGTSTKKTTAHPKVSGSGISSAKVAGTPVKKSPAYSYYSGTSLKYIYRNDFKDKLKSMLKYGIINFIIGFFIGFIINVLDIFHSHITDTGDILSHSLEWGFYFCIPFLIIGYNKG